MKATFFRVTQTTTEDGLPGINAEFQIMFEDNEPFKNAIYIFQLNEDLEAIGVLQGGRLEELTPWQSALLAKSKDYIKSQVNALYPEDDWQFIKPPLKTYLVQITQGHIHCKAEDEIENKANDEATLDDCFTSAWNSFTEAASEAFESISKAAASFFSPEPEVDSYCFGIGQDRVSCFEPTQVTQIEKLINSLDKEIKSRWPNNKDLKIFKKDRLIDMLTASRKSDSDPHQIISEFKTKHPRMLEGAFSRVEALLDEISPPDVSILKKI